MRHTLVSIIALLLACSAAQAKDAATVDAKKAPGGDKEMSGMSVVGNDDAPKSLVIVPWKSSGLGDVLDVSRALDDSRLPVDRDVFMRELDYYQIRESSGAKGPSTN